MSGLDKPRIRHNFSRFAVGADNPGETVAERLWDRVKDMRLSPRRALDAGGDGNFLQKAYPQAETLAIDFTLPVIRRSHARRRLCADVENQPLAPSSIDLLWSNLCLEWTDPSRFLGEAHRILRTGGLIAATTLGPDTLKELRTAFSERHSVHPFADMHNIGDLLLAHRFAEPILESEQITLSYKTPAQAITDCRNLGGGSALSQRRRGLTGRASWQRALAAYPQTAEDGRYAATFEIIYLTAWKAEKISTVAPLTFHPHP